MRKVINIPALHNSTDMNGVGPYQGYLGLDASSQLKEWAQRHDADFFGEVEGYWDRVNNLLDQTVTNGELDLQRVLLYTEGADASLEEVLPSFIENANVGSRHCKLDLDLISRGATYEMTESEEMLTNRGRLHSTATRAKQRAYTWIPGIYEARRIKLADPRLDEINRLQHKIMDDKRREKLEGQRWALVDRLYQKIDELRPETDRGVATIIDTTLKEGKTGILVFGLNHEISQFLPKDIEFSPLHPELVEHANAIIEKTKFWAGKEPEGQHSGSTERR